MLKVQVQHDSLQFGEGFSLDFQRTLRIPDDDKPYPLPPGLGRFPVCQVDDYKEHVPPEWNEHGGVFIPMYQREALWINFSGRHWKPNTVKVAVGKINAVSGKSWSQELIDGDEDYMVSPPQPWLDGINAGDGFIKQFVAMPLGMGYTVEAQVTGEEKFGGIQIVVYEPKSGKFPDEAPRTAHGILGDMAIAQHAIAAGAEPPRAMLSQAAEMGLGAGGRMKQKIYPDDHGIETWDQDNYGRVYVHIVNSMMYREITGKEPPNTPVTARTYTQYGLPWFDLYDESKSDIAAPDVLKDVKSVKEMDGEKGFSAQQDDSTVDVPDSQVKKIKLDPDEVRDGDW